MFRKMLLTLFIVILMLSLVACTPRKVTSTPKAGLPNPASVYCEEHGGKVDIRTDTSGAQAGVCVFPNGSECDGSASIHAIEIEVGATRQNG